MWSWLSAKRSSDRVQDASPRAGVEGNGAVSRLREALPRISAEFERARRYERSVTVVVFARPASGGTNGGNGHQASAADARSLAGVLASATREIDLVICETQCCVVMMPEIGTEDGRRAVRRMRELCAHRLETPVAAGIAVFPEDGWLFLDLVDVARREARTSDDDRAAAKEERSGDREPVRASMRVERAHGA